MYQCFGEVQIPISHQNSGTKNIFNLNNFLHNKNTQ